MYGGIYGDLVGSIYEYEENKCHNKELMIKASREEELLKPNSFYSDDTILIIAIADAILHGNEFDAYLRKYICENSGVLNRPNYFKYMFSPNTVKWGLGHETGYSCGNGAAMRISPVAAMGQSFIKVTHDTIAATTPSHNHESAIRAALCVSNMIFFAKNGSSKEYIKSVVDKYFKYDYDFDLDTLRNNMTFNYTCDDTMPIVLYSIFNSDSFDSAIRLCLSIGGDTDTNCCIVGSIAEYMYGMDEDLKVSVNNYLPDEYKLVLRKAQSKCTVNE